MKTITTFLGLVLTSSTVFAGTLHLWFSKEATLYRADLPRESCELLKDNSKFNADTSICEIYGGHSITIDSVGKDQGFVSISTFGPLVHSSNKFKGLMTKRYGKTMIVKEIDDQSYEFKKDGCELTITQKNQTATLTLGPTCNKLLMNASGSKLLESYSETDEGS